MVIKLAAAGSIVCCLLGLQLRGLGAQQAVHSLLVQTLWDLP